MSDSEKSTKNSSGLPFLVSVICLLAISIVFREQIGQYLSLAQDWIKNQGVLGVIAFIALYVTTTVLFVPGSILTLGAGAIYGVLWGTIIVSIASVTGATLAFLIARHFAKDWVAKKIDKNPKFKAVDSAIAKEGRNIVFLIRLSPAFPFNFLNYAFGVTKVKLQDYILASWAGMLPGTVLYVYLGSIASELATAGGGERSKSPAEWAVLIVGLIATIAVTVYTTKVAKKALAEKGA